MCAATGLPSGDFVLHKTAHASSGAPDSRFPITAWWGPIGYGCAFHRALLPFFGFFIGCALFGI